MKVLITLILLTPKFLAAEVFCEKDNIYCSQERFLERFTSNFKASGLNEQNNNCQVDFWAELNIPALDKSVTRETITIKIADQTKTPVTYHGSWHYQGARGGCLSIDLDTDDIFHLRQIDETSRNCNARPGRLFGHRGSVEFEKIDSKYLKIIVNDDFYNVSNNCTIENKNYFK